MALPFYATVHGTKQGDFKGEAVGKDVNRIPGAAFSYGLSSPLDSQSGLPTGRRRHEAVVFAVDWGKWSPQFYQAMYTNENLPTVQFEFYAVDTAGEQLDHTIRLTNASIESVRQSLQTVESGGPVVDTRNLQVISFAFQKIEIESLTGRTTATDEWEAKA